KGTSGAPGRARRHAGHRHRRGPAGGTSLDVARGALAQRCAIRTRMARTLERPVHDARGRRSRGTRGGARAPASGGTAGDGGRDLHIVVDYDPLTTTV